MKQLHVINPSLVNDPIERRFWEAVRANFLEIYRGVANVIEPGNNPSPIAGNISHHGLADLTTFDDHSQYLYLAGRTGGQTGYGGTAAADTLILGATFGGTDSDRGRLQLLNTATGSNDVVRIGTFGATTRLRIDRDGRTYFASSTTAGVVDIGWNAGGPVLFIGTSGFSQTVAFKPTASSFDITFADGNGLVNFFGAINHRYQFTGRLLAVLGSSDSNTNITETVTRKSGQTGDLTRWQDEAGTPNLLAKVTKDGYVNTPILQLQGASVIVGHKAAAGGVTYDLTWPSSAPAANSSLALFSTAGVISYSTTIPAATLATLPYVAVSAAYPVTATDGIIDCTGGPYNVTLPDAAGITGRYYVIKNSGTGVVTVVGTGGDTIDGGASAVLQVQYVSITVYSDGVNWKVM